MSNPPLDIATIPNNPTGIPQTIGTFVGYPTPLEAAIGLSRQGRLKEARDIAAAAGITSANWRDKL